MMIQVAQMTYRNRELDQECLLPTLRDVRVGRNIFTIIEGTRQWVEASRVDAEGRLIR